MSWQKTHFLLNGSISDITHSKHPKSKTPSLPSIPHPKHLTFPHSPFQHPICQISHIPNILHPNILHPKYSTSQTFHMSNISHSEYYSHPKHCTSQTLQSLTPHIANILHPKHPASQTFYIPNIRHSVQKDYTLKQRF